MRERLDPRNHTKIDTPDISLPCCASTFNGLVTFIVQYVCSIQDLRTRRIMSIKVASSHRKTTLTECNI